MMMSGLAGSESSKNMGNKVEKGIEKQSGRKQRTRYRRRIKGGVVGVGSGPVSGRKARVRRATEQQEFGKRGDRTESGAVTMSGTTSRYSKARSSNRQAMDRKQTADMQQMPLGKGQARSGAWLKATIVNSRDSVMVRDEKAAVRFR